MSIENYPKIMEWVILMWCRKMPDGTPVWEDNEIVCELRGMEKAAQELDGSIDLISDLQWLQAIKEETA